MAISVSSMLGSGIFVLPGLAVITAGENLWLAYLISAICVLPAAMSKSELATAMPNSGGTYIYLERTFGPLMGTISGLGLWLSLLLKSAFALVGIGTYLLVLTYFPLTHLVLLILAFIVAINIMGVGKVGNALIALVIISIGGLTIINLFSLQHFIYSRSLFAIQDFTSVIEAAALVFVSYAGVTKVAAIAEEVIEPEKNLPRGIFISLALVAAIYTITSVFLVGTSPLDQLKYNLKPIHTLASVGGSHALGMFAVILSIVTMSGMANSGVLAASRFPFAMSRDHLLPKFLGKLGKRSMTPIYSILLSGGLIAISVIALDVIKMAKLASVFILIIYMCENLAVIILRETRVQWYSPSYRAPMYPFVQIFGLASSLYLLVGLAEMIVPALSFICIPGIFLYLFYSRHKTDRKGVLGIRGKRKELTEEASKANYFQSLLSPEDSRKNGVVIALFGQERSPEMLIELGLALSHNRSPEVLHLTEIPEQTALDDIMEETAEVRSLRRRIVAMNERNSASITYDPLISHDIYKSVLKVSQSFHCHWLVKEFGGRTHGAFTMHNQMGWLEDHLFCNIATVRDSGVRFIKKVLVFLDLEDMHDVIKTTAIHLARIWDSEITLAIFAPQTTSQGTIVDLNEKLREHLSPEERMTKALVLQGQNLVKTVVAETIEYDLLIFKANRKINFYESLFGSTQDKLIEKAACSVCMIQAYTGKES